MKRPRRTSPRERPNCEVHATECSTEALLVAEQNRRNHELNNVQFYQGSWTQPLSGLFHLVVSNPPYVAHSDPHLHQGDCRFEPRLALEGGEDGLDALRQIAAEAMTRLTEGGWLLLELGHDQGEAVRSILHKDGYSEISTYRDLAGIERVCAGRRPAD